MNKNNLNKLQRKKLTKILGFSGVFLLLFIAVFQTKIAHSQNEIPFRVGERLTYNISFENFENAAYAEIYVVSRGKLAGQNAVELSAKIKSVDLLSAAFYFFDQERTTFALSETGLPIYVKKVSNTGIMPLETVENFINAPTANYDLLTLIYKIRNSNGIGTFLLQENGKIYSFTIQTMGVEKIQSDLGNYDTTKINVQSAYLTDLGITNLTVNLSSDEQKLPVLMRLTTAKGKFRVELASIQIFRDESNPDITPTPTPIPIPVRTPTPVPTPTPYINNQPLIERLPFNLGETLEFKITKQKEDFGTVVFQAKERKQFLGKDSLLLTAFAKDRGIQPIPILNINDGITAQVDPVSLMPTLTELKFSYGLKTFNQITKFDQENGFVLYDGEKRVEIPVGTHSLLSLAYAIRSFNLKPSLDPKNPVNDTRVALFLGDQAYVLTLRPSESEIINLKGQKVTAQLISVRTGNQTIDNLNINLWLGVDANRLPLRISAGEYQADLVSVTKNSPK